MRKIILTFILIIGSMLILEAHHKKKKSKAGVEGNQTGNQYYSISAEEYSGCIEFNTLMNFEKCWV